MWGTAGTKRTVISVSGYFLGGPRQGFGTFWESMSWDRENHD